LAKIYTLREEILAYTLREEILADQPIRQIRRNLAEVRTMNLFWENSINLFGER